MTQTSLSYAKLFKSGRCTVEGTSTVSETVTCTGLTSLPPEGLSVEVSLVHVRARSKEPPSGRIAAPDPA